MRILLILLLTGNVFAGMAQQAGDTSGTDSAGTLNSGGKNLLDSITGLISRHQYPSALKRLESFPSGGSDIEVLNLKGYCYSRLGRYADAVAVYEEALRRDSSHTATLSRLADLYRSGEEYGKAFSLYDRLSIADSLNSYFHKQGAWCLQKAGMTLQAILWYEKARRLNPEDKEIVLRLARIYFELDDFLRCDSLLDEALAADTSDIALLSMKARSKYRQKEYDTAWNALKSVFSMGDTSLTNMRLAGNALYALDKHEECLSWFERIPKDLREQDEYIQYMMGVSYRQLGQLKESVYHLQTAIALAISDNISIYYQQLGLTQEKRGDAREAIAAFKTAGIYKDEGILYYHLARLHDYYRKDPDEALKYYKRYLASGDSSAEEAWKFSRRRVDQLE